MHSIRKKTTLLYLAVTILTAAALTAAPEKASAFGTEDCIGSVALFAGTFAPQNWAFCNGQILEISQYTALYSLIGNYYGGDGYRTFALPDLRGRVVIGAGRESIVGDHDRVLPVLCIDTLLELRHIQHNRWQDVVVVNPLVNAIHRSVSPRDHHRVGEHLLLDVAPVLRVKVFDTTQPIEAAHGLH